MFGREHTPIREYRFAVDSDGNYSIVSEFKEFGSLETDQLNDIKSMVALPEEQACVFAFLNGRVEIVRRRELDLDS